MTAVIAEGEYEQKGGEEAEKDGERAPAEAVVRRRARRLGHGGLKLALGGHDDGSLSANATKSTLCSGAISLMAMREFSPFPFWWASKPKAGVFSKVWRVFPRLA